MLSLLGIFIYSPFLLRSWRFHSLLGVVAHVLQWWWYEWFRKNAVHVSAVYNSMRSSNRINTRLKEWITSRVLYRHREDCLCRKLMLLLPLLLDYYHQISNQHVSVRKAHSIERIQLTVPIPVIDCLESESEVMRSLNSSIMSMPQGCLSWLFAPWKSATPPSSIVAVYTMARFIKMRHSSHWMTWAARILVSLLFVLEYSTTNRMSTSQMGFVLDSRGFDKLETNQI